MIIEVTLPDKILSLNQRDKMHWSARAKHRKQWERVLRFELARYLNCMQAGISTKAKVLITSYRKRLLDEDNLHGGCKPIFDSLKALGLIWDDSPNHLAQYVAQEKVKSPIPEGTQIVIEH